MHRREHQHQGRLRSIHGHLWTSALDHSNYVDKMWQVGYGHVAAGQTTPANAASGAAFAPAPALPGGIVIPLWPGDSPKLNQARVGEPEVYNMNDPDIREGIIKQANNIHNPSLEAHPFGAGGCGAAVICVPGGGHQQIGVSGGGTDFVPFFASFGVSTIVLRPRLRVDGYNMTTDAVWDTQQAIRIVRSRAVEWGIDSAKIGVLGFSAGAELVAAASLEYTAFDMAHSGPDDELTGISSRPDFVGLIYPGPTPFETMKSRKLAGPDHGEPTLMGSRLHGISEKVAGEPLPVAPAIPDDVPPSFSASAGVGDLIHAVWATEYFTAMLEAKVPNTEIHIYASGNHGGGITHMGGIPFVMDWFRDLGFLGPNGKPTKASKDVEARRNDPDRWLWDNH